jgi:hypothetical protein
MQDVTYVVERTKSLTDPSMPSPMEILEEVVKAKPTPRRAAHMSTALNGLLRRKNDPANSSTTSVNEPRTIAQEEPENMDADIDDEDALVTNDVPAEVQEPPVIQQAEDKLLETDNAVTPSSAEVVKDEPFPLSNETTASSQGIGDVLSDHDPSNLAGGNGQGGADVPTSDEVKAEKEVGVADVQPPQPPAKGTTIE